MNGKRTMIVDVGDISLVARRMLTIGIIVGILIGMAIGKGAML